MTEPDSAAPAVRLLAPLHASPCSGPKMPRRETSSWCHRGFCVPVTVSPGGTRGRDRARRGYVPLALYCWPLRGPRGAESLYTACNARPGGPEPRTPRVGDTD